jgi:hypothetical protein
MCNADLLTQLANKERQLQHFSKMIAPQEELAASHEKLKGELEEAKKEISRYGTFSPTSAVQDLSFISIFEAESFLTGFFS